MRRCIQAAGVFAGLGALAAKYDARGCWVQSHCAESVDEMAFVEQLHPGKRDVQIFAEGMTCDGGSLCVTV